MFVLWAVFLDLSHILTPRLIVRVSVVIEWPRLGRID